MKKICHMTITDQECIPRLLRECKSATAAGVETYIVSPGISFVENGITFLGIQKPNSRGERFMKTGKKVFQAALSTDADIYQIHDPELLLYAKKLLHTGKKVIFDSHEFYGLQILEREYIPGPLRKLVSKLYTIYETYICKKLDAVIQVCTVQGKNYFGNRCKESIFLANLPQKVLYFDKYIEKTNSSPEPTICYCGAITDSRGITALVQAVDKVPAKVLLGGAFDSEEYKKELTQFSGYKYVDYRGIMSYEEIIQAYHCATIGYSVFADRGQYTVFDSIATKCFECMSMGLPVIQLDTEYARKVDDKYHCFYFVSTCSATEVARAIEFLITHPEEANQMGRNGRRAIDEEFNWEKEEQKLISLYGKLLK